MWSASNKQGAFYMKVRQVRIEGDVAYVPLTRGYEAVIDASDVHLVDGFNWYADTSRSTVYAKRTVNGANPYTVKMHRVITGCPADLFVDHKDCDGLNNRRSNLRVATVSQNNHNTRVRSNNSSGFKGVTFHKYSGKWQANIWINSKKLFLGSYESPEAAHLAYAVASAQVHGEFGRTA